MRVDQLQVLAASARGLRLRLLHGVEHGIEEVQRKHHQHARKRIGALELPCNPAGEALQLVGALLWIHPIGFHVLGQRNGRQGIGVGIAVGQVGPLVSVRIREYHLRADFLRGADGFHERVGRLDGHIGRGFGFVINVAALRAADRIVIESLTEICGRRWMASR